MHVIYTRPTLAVLGLGVISVLLSLLTSLVVLRQPWLGIGLQVSAAGDRVVAAQLAPPLDGARTAGVEVLRLVSATGGSMELKVTDLIEEPDFFDSYEEMGEFFARQTALSALLRSGPLAVVWRDPQGGEQQKVVMPGGRPLSSLGLAFWFQLGVGYVALLIAAWVFVLRPDDWGARLFAVTGLAFPVFTTTAAIYSSRELALPGELFRVLSSVNHLGANIFGCALAGLFLMYPKPLARPRALLWFALVFGVWWLADALRWAPNQNWGSRLPIVLQMLLAIWLGWRQWRSSSRLPLDRAALRWFALSSLVSCSLFILSVPVPSVLGLFAPLPQGYAFGFFLFMYMGIALGLRKYRLFELDEWALRIWLWLIGIVAVLAMDAALLYLGLDQGISLGVTLLVCGGLYFPFRQWLWQRFFTRRKARIEHLLPTISRIAFIANTEEQTAAWSTLLRQLFNPLEVTIRPHPVTQTQVQEDGLLLQVPACHSLPAFQLRYAGNGARLFSTRDAQFVEALSLWMREVMSGRTRYELGVVEERLRIGRDLHDNIGARLLKMIHQLRGTPTADVARDAMKDLRTAIAALDGHPVPLMDALADWRAEAEARCETAGCRLIWQQAAQVPTLESPSRTKAMLEAVVRELITNALKHAAPNCITVAVDLAHKQLELTVVNDGVITSPSTWVDGYGLRNIRGRLGEIGGALSIGASERDVRLTIRARLP